MAITVPDDCERQPRESEGVASNGSKSFAYILKGPYSSLKTLLDGLKKGAEVESGWVMSTATLARCPGNLGELRIECAENDTEAGGGGGGGQSNVQKALSEIWTLKSVRNDVSILAYCGPSASNPTRELIEAWMKEPDGALAAANKFRKQDGTIEEITDDEDLALMGKIRKGIDSVMRFYPLLTKTRTYSKPPAVIYQNLARIDTPAIGTDATSKTIEKPGNLDAIISACSWLKCQDDCALTGDAKYQRIESWMGIPNAGAGASAWDPDLYGPSQWPMPLHVGEGGIETGGGENGGGENGGGEA